MKHILTFLLSCLGGSLAGLFIYDGIANKSPVSFCIGFAGLLVINAFVLFHEEEKE
jgi:fatty acid desaturase